MMNLLRRSGVFWIALLSVMVIGGAVACGGAEDTTPAAPAGPSASEIASLVSDAVKAAVPADTGASAADIQKMIDSAVSGIDTGLSKADIESSIKAQMGNTLSAADVKKVVDSAISAMPAPKIDAAAIRSQVEAAVAATGVKAADISKLVEAAVSSSSAKTRGELAADIEKAVKEASGGQLTAADVTKIVDASVSAAVDEAKKATAAAEAALKASSKALELVKLPEASRVGAREGFSKVTLPELEPPPRDMFKSDLTLEPVQEVNYLYQSGPKQEITPPFREGGGDRSMYWWMFMPPFHFGSIENNFGLRQGFATGYSVSDDGTEYLLHINPDAIFQDGTPISAKSVKEAWEFAAWPDNQVGWGAILLHTRAIAGMEALEAGDATEASGLKVIDDLTLSITLKQFTPTWPLQMAVWMLGVFKPDQAKNDPDAFRVNPIGVGPYRATYDDSTDTQYYTATKNWWGPAPVVQKVIRPTVRDLQVGYLMYENGELDILYADSVRQPAIWQPDNPFHGDLKLQGGKGLWYTAYVTDHAPFDDVNVRKAFAHAADMWNIVPAILGPKAQYGAGLITEGNACSQWPDYGFKYDPEAARGFLAASKYGSAENVPIPTLEISRPSIIRIFEVVQEQWKDNLGIEINLVRLEPGQKRRDVVEFRRQSLGGRIPDPSGILSDLGHSSSGTVKNSGKFSNPQLDALIEAAQKLNLDDANYCAAWNEIEKTIMDNAYYFPLMAGDDRTWVVQPWLQGYVGSLGQYMNSMPWWKVGIRDRSLY
jgi:ABC-type transport system substrate-binding protein/BMFP domain-containing protein YqiC